jgi:hypothetical protein
VEEEDEEQGGQEVGYEDREGCCEGKEKGSDGGWEEREREDWEVEEES